jgi:hypothetical protein
MATLAGRGLSAVECPLWLILLATIGPVSVRAVQRIRDAGQGRALAAVIGLAVALRVLVPWEPIYWHYPLMNLDLGTVLYTRPNTYLPWLLRVIVFDLQGGFDAALLFNLLAGTASIILLWYAARGSHSTRVCVLFGLLLASPPCMCAIPDPTACTWRSCFSIRRAQLLCLPATAAR